MRRALITVALVLVAIGAVVVVAAQAGTDEDTYLIRGVFDGASFVVPDEDVRVGGANVGHVESIDVAREGEIVSREDGGKPVPGKAIIVMAITEPGFTDFREDAACVIRPQSLIGEKYINCRPTVPRRPGVDPPPPLEQIPDDQPGAGQYLLPLENNGKTVDVDLVNNVMRKPASERFRIILNELGGTFAARGGDIEEIVERANPALREVNRVFAILTEQRDQLAQLAADSDAIMQPLARERQRVVGFMRNSGESAEASAEYGAQISESFSKFPIFLAEFRQTMAELGGFADEAAPVVRDLEIAAPAFTRATEALAPFSEASLVALESLGENGLEAAPLFNEALPVLRTASNVSISGVKPLYDFSSLLTSIRRTDGFEGLMDLIYNTTATMNGYDSFGHYARTLIVPTNCLNYETSTTTGCSANFRSYSQEFSSEAELLDYLTELVLELAENEEDGAEGGIDASAILGGAEIAGDGDGSDDADGSGSGDAADGEGGTDGEDGTDSGTDPDGSGASDGASGDGTGSGSVTSGSGSGSGAGSDSGTSGSGTGSGAGSSASASAAGFDLLRYLLGP